MPEHTLVMLVSLLNLAVACGFVWLAVKLRVSARAVQQLSKDNLAIAETNLTIAKGSVEGQSRLDQILATTSTLIDDFIATQTGDDDLGDRPDPPAAAPPALPPGPASPRSGPTFGAPV